MTPVGAGLPMKCRNFGLGNVLNRTCEQEKTCILEPGDYIG